MQEYLRLEERHVCLDSINATALVILIIIRWLREPSTDNGRGVLVYGNALRRTLDDCLLRMPVSEQEALYN